MKITEALSNVITEAGGTPTAEDAESVTHALGTLYTTLGGTDELPNDVAERINSLSDHIGGGGGSDVPTCTLTVEALTRGQEISLYTLHKTENGWSFDPFPNFNGGATVTIEDVCSEGLIVVYASTSGKSVSVSDMVRCHRVIEGTWYITSSNTRNCIALSPNLGVSSASFKVTVA